MNLYLVSVLPNPGVQQEEVQRVINLAPDWYRFRAGCWVIATPETPQMWTNRLSHLGGLGHIIVLRLDHNDHWGIAGTDFWEWLGRYRRPW
jgi:hypothetical protein